MRFFDTILGVESALIAELQAELANLRLEKEALQQELDALKRRLFGRSSEKLDESQQQLFDDTEQNSGSAAEPAETVVRSHTRRHHPRKPLSDSLPREEILIDIPEEEKQCACGHELERIGEEVSEKLEVVPARFVIKRYVRPRYACKHCEGSGDEEKPAVRIAAMPPAVIPKGIATPALLAFIIVAKFVDAIPLFRQVKSFARMGVDLARQRLADWVLAVGEAFAAVIEQLVRHLRAGPILLVDETTVQVLGEEDRPDTSRSYMWAAFGGEPEKPAVYYRYAEGRSTAEAEAIVGDFSGYLQADGYEVYERLARNWSHLTLVACWAHARRKFFDAKESSKKAGAADEAIAMIARLYRIERELAEMPRDEHFLRVRGEQVAPVFAQLKAWLDKKALHVPPQTALGKAVGYALGQWDKLVRYIESPYLTPDTNRVENKIRPFVIGRKNWLFSGSPRGAKSSAALYSLIETAKANGVDPYRYLRVAIERLPYARTESDYRNLLPQFIDLTSS